MYQKLPNLVIGFHGCTQDVFDAVVLRGEQMKFSTNDYDWLGNGIYFWEQSYQRAKEWAEAHTKGCAPAVIGAVIDLGYCLNLTDCASSDILRRGYQALRVLCESTGAELPKNRQIKANGDVLVRNLDCAVIEQVHDYNRMTNQAEFDSVRGVFWEGDPPYPGSSFTEKTHVQICVRNPNCIKGIFTPRFKTEGYSIP